MKRLLSVVLGCLVATAACAANLRAVRESVEASMVVTGDIEVSPQGTVTGYHLDEPGKLPAAVSQAIGQTLPAWTFEPVVRDGKPVAAKAKMSLRLVARPLGEGRFRVLVHGAWFGEQDLSIKRAKAQAPRYPRDALRERAGGVVYLLLRVDRAGRVVDAAAEQVNLRVVADSRTLDRLRTTFADATVKVAGGWTFTPAPVSDDAPYRVLRVPVVYAIYGTPFAHETYGQWQPYVPGPRQPVPWLDDQPLAGSPDALPGEGLYGAPALSLRTPLGSG